MPTLTLFRERDKWADLQCLCFLQGQYQAGLLSKLELSTAASSDCEHEFLLITFSNISRPRIARSPAQTQPAARLPGGNRYPAASPTTWGALMIGHPRQRGPPPEGSRGPAGVKGQGAEPRGGAQPAADRGAIVNRNIIRPRRGRNV